MTGSVLTCPVSACTSISVSKLLEGPVFEEPLLDGGLADFCDSGLAWATWTLISSTHLVSISMIGSDSPAEMTSTGDVCCLLAHSAFWWSEVLGEDLSWSPMKKVTPLLIPVDMAARIADDCANYNVSQYLPLPNFF